MRYAVIISMLITLAATASAAKDAGPGWKIDQITSCDNGVSAWPQLTRDGNTLFFISTCDFAERNDDHSAEIFKWNNERIFQLTDNPHCQIADLALAPDDKTVAFVSNCDLDGKNPGRGLELAIMNEDGKIRVITKGHGFPSRNPAWSPDGKFLVFESLADLAGLNFDGSREIFMVDLTTATLDIKQMTSTISANGCEDAGMASGAIICRCNDDIPGTRSPEEHGRLSITVDGRSVGDNPDHNYEIFRINTSGRPKQITKTIGCENGPPLLHPYGRSMIFVSNCPLAGEEYGEGKRTLYFYAAEFKKPYPDLEIIALAMDWSGDGKRIAISSNLSYEDVNPEHNIEVFVFDAHKPGKAPRPVTDFKYGGAEKPVLNQDGSVVVFVSSYNMDGKNRDGSPELFMAREIKEKDD